MRLDSAERDLLEVDLFFLEDVANRLAADVFDPELPQFPDNTGLSESCGLCDFDHELSQLTGLPLATLGILSL